MLFGVCEKHLSKRGIEKEDLIPALSPLLVKWRFQLHNLWNSVAASKAASICIASLVMIFTGGFVITRRSHPEISGTYRNQRQLCDAIARPSRLKIDYPLIFISNISVAPWPGNPAQHFIRMRLRAISANFSIAFGGFRIIADQFNFAADFRLMYIC